jgi:glucosamine--fructose-6-phosphate aminotransferase (isomerizing)
MTGSLMQAEMAEQPGALAGLIARADEIASLVTRPSCGSTVVARGSSDHAGVYGRYLLELASGRPAGLAAPSLATLYEAPVDFSGYLAVAVSQSGHTPEIVTALLRMQAEGAAGLAITNDGASPLASAADATIALGVGEEKAVPATKTVTATLTAFALVAAAMGSPLFAEISSLPEWVARVLDDPAPSEEIAAALVDATRLLTVGRGLMFGGALEAALKLKETTMISAEGFSAADLRHGPIAIVEGLPVLAFLAQGPAHADMADLVSDLRARGAAVHAIEFDVPEVFAPILAVVRAQQIALSLARRRGLDADAPRGLSKVTATR